MPTEIVLVVYIVIGTYILSDMMWSIYKCILPFLIDSTPSSFIRRRRRNVASLPTIGVSINLISFF